MASGNITTRTNLAAPQPTMLLYAGLSPFGVTDDRKITANALFQEITANITDLSVQFGDGVAAAVSAAGKGKLIYNDTAKVFQISVDGGAYATVTALGNTTTGTGAIVRATSPTLVTPALGTPTALVLTNATGLPPVAGIVGWPANASGVLTNNGAGVLSWGAVSGTPGGSPGEVQWNDAGAFNGTSGLTATATTITIVFGVSAVFSNAGNNLTLTNTTDAASVQLALLRGNRATVTTNDEAYVSLSMANASAAQKEIGRLTWAIFPNTAGAEGGRLDFSVADSGTLAKRIQLSPLDLSPSNDNAVALGENGTLQWSDLFLGSGALIGFDNSNVLLTHSSGILTVTTGDLRVTTAGTNAASVATLNGTQSFQNKTITNSNNVLGGVTMTLGSDADGDVYYRAGGVLTRLGIGVAGQVLTVNAGATAPEWAAASGGITVNVTTITGGTTGRLVYDNAGTFGEISGLTTNGSTTLTQTSNSATAFESGPNGATNPVFRLVNNTASSATGISITGAAQNGGVTISAISSGSNESISIVPLGTGRVRVSAGTATSPGLGFNGQITTGISGVGDQLVCTANGVEIGRFNDTSTISGLYLGPNQLTFASTAGSSGDIGMRREAANVLRMTNGTTNSSTVNPGLLISPNGPTITGFFTVLPNSATTNAVIDLARLGANTTGTAAAGFGGRLSFSLESNTTTDQQAAGVEWIWTNATHASRTARLAFTTVDNAVSAERMSLDVNGIRLPEIASAATPAANNVYVYSKDKSGVSNLYFKNDAGTEFDLGIAGSGITGSGTNNYLTKWTTAGSVIGDSIMVESGGNLITTAGKHVFQGITINTDATNTVGSFQSNWTLTKNDANSRTFFGALFEPTFNVGGSNASTTVNVLAVDTINTAVTGLTVNLLHVAYGGTEVFSIDSMGAISFVSDVRQAFSPGATVAGLNVGSVITDPSSLVNGDIWYDSVTNELKAFVNGVAVVLA